MRIQCDACGDGDGAVFCVSDEAAVCAACDGLIHHANKLAGKHLRYALHRTPPPVCDICQERKAFLLCKEDRAILCRECDGPIHRANEHTQNHTRFLLTGVKVSPTPSVYSDNNDPIPKCTPSNKAKGTTPAGIQQPVNEHYCTTFSACSISDYLIKTLPGWHVEDFLDSSSHDFLQNGENELLPYWDPSHMSMDAFPSDEVGVWVPQVHPTQDDQQQVKEVTSNSSRSARKRKQDECFAVPRLAHLQVSPADPDRHHKEKSVYEDV